MMNASLRVKAVRIAACLAIAIGCFATAPRAEAALLFSPAESAAESGLRRTIDPPNWSPLPAPTAYRGLGTWIDIYDSEPFDHPEETVRAAAARGVKTLYVETANSGSASAIYRSQAMHRLIRAAHARGIKVVAWYLPTLRYPSHDYARCVEAIRFRTYDGQRFDSFALDIESSAVKPTSERNKRLLALSKRLRANVGAKYPLGAIIPSPAGMSKSETYWVGFPYTELNDIYDVFLPMGYYTYHGDGAELAYQDSLDNVAILREQPGCERAAVHLIGGLSQYSTNEEVRMFVLAARESDCCGASLYDWGTTTTAHWRQLAAFSR